MLLSRTPQRLSLFGGMSDIESFFIKHGGICVGFAIDKYSYLVQKDISPILGYDIKASYSNIETASHHSQIQHPAIRECLKYWEDNFHAKHQLELHHISDLPSKIGLGTSSSFIVGLLNILNTLYKTGFSKKQIAKLAIYIERSVLNESGGVQDQLWAAYGGLNEIRLTYINGPEFEVIPIKVSDNDYGYLEDSLVLIYTGQTRIAAEVTNKYIHKITEEETEKYTLNIVDLAKASIQPLKNLDIKTVGKLLHESWLNKKAVSNNISNEYLDNLYEFGIKNGSLGGKLIGAGGGGCLLFVIPPEKRAIFVESMCKSGKLFHISFKIDWSGSTVKEI